MAISDTSIYNTYIARGLQKPNASSLSADTIPKDLREEINSRIVRSIEENDGVVPNELYLEIANIISPYVPSMSGKSLASLLRVNNLFGVGETSQYDFNIDRGSSDYKELYEKKLSEVNKRTARTFSDNETGGFITDVANEQTGSDKGEIPAMVQSTAEPLPGPPSYEVGSSEITDTGKFVSSVEELEYDMGSAARDISEIIVHTSETFQNANLTGSELQSLTGAGDASYHYIIKRDGSIERGVSIQSAGNHCPGHNSYSIGVCLVGGVAASNDEEGLLARIDAGTITRSQYNSLYEIFRVFFTQYPGGQALGHSEVDNNEDDPGFEVRDYVYNLFNKSSLYTKTENESELSPDDINSSEDGEGTTVTEKDTELLDQKF